MRLTARGRAAVTRRLRGPSSSGHPRAMTPDERLAACGLTRDEIASRVAASRVGQGLPPRVEDRAALARMAALVVARRASPPARP